MEQANKLKILLSIQLLRNIRDRTRWNEDNPFMLPTDEFNKEGWKVTKPDGAAFARTAEFKDESAKVFFMLKYGG